MQSSEHRKAGEYFDRKAALFDSLYSPDKLSPFMRFVNSKLRNDIYERYVLTISHIKLTKAGSVLDVGIGSGRYAGGYVEAGVKRVVGVDISSSMLDLTREHLKNIEIGKTEFELLLTDIDDFDSHETFDVAVAMGFFDYIPDPIPSLVKLRKLTNHSVIASFPSISWYRTPIRLVRYAIKRCPVYFYRVSQIHELSKRAGFGDCQVTKIKGAGMDYVAILRH